MSLSCKEATPTDVDTKWDLYGTVSVNRTLLWVLPREEELGYLLPHFPSGSALSKADS